MQRNPAINFYWFSILPRITLKLVDITDMKDFKPFMIGGLEKSDEEQSGPESSLLKPVYMTFIFL